MDITYGIQGEESRDYASTAMEASDAFAIASTPGAFYVEQIPICELSYFAPSNPILN